MTEPTKEYVSVFPRLIEEGIYLCGFNSPKSYGATSYFIQHSEGNWLIDSPRFNPYLENQFEAKGGLKYIFLTHQDDVADADQYAERFGAKRIIHKADRRAAPDAEIFIEGLSPLSLVPGFTIIPVPGHTRGHSVLLYKDKFLFTGDHLEWDPSYALRASEGSPSVVLTKEGLPSVAPSFGAKEGALGAYRDYCWYDWTEQTMSMERLLNYSFEWVLPGHGHRKNLPADQMKIELQKLIQRMKE